MLRTKNDKYWLRNPGTQLGEQVDFKCLNCSWNSVTPIRNQTMAGFRNHRTWLKLNPKYFMQHYTYFRQFISKVKSRILSSHMNLHKHQSYLLEQHSESFEI